MIVHHVIWITDNIILVGLFLIDIQLTHFIYSTFYFCFLFLIIMDLHIIVSWISNQSRQIAIQNTSQFVSNEINRILSDFIIHPFQFQCLVLLYDLFQFLVLKFIHFHNILSNYLFEMVLYFRRQKVRHIQFIKEVFLVQNTCIIKRVFYEIQFPTSVDPEINICK